MSAVDLIQSSQESQYTPLDPATSYAEKMLTNRTRATDAPGLGPVDYNPTSPYKGDV